VKRDKKCTRLDMQKPPAGQPVWRFLRETVQRKLQQRELQQVVVVKQYKI